VLGEISGLESALPGLVRLNSNSGSDKLADVTVTRRVRLLSNPLFFLFDILIGIIGLVWYGISVVSNLFYTEVPTLDRNLWEGLGLVAYIPEIVGIIIFASFIAGFFVCRRWAIHLVSALKRGPHIFKYSSILFLVASAPLLLAYSFFTIVIYHFVITKLGVLLFFVSSGYASGSVLGRFIPLWNFKKRTDLTVFICHGKKASSENISFYSAERSIR